MELVILSIHLLVCICLIGLVLLQRSEGGALGMGGGTGSLMSGRGAADALARMTSVAGGFFLVTSLGLTMLSGANAASQGGSVFDRAPAERAAPAIPAPTPAERPDPTESSIPAETQLASLTPGGETAAVPPPVAPAPVQAAARAAPLETSPQPRTQPASTRPAAQPTTRPATPPAQQPTAQPASARTTVPATQQRSTTTAPAQRPSTGPTTTANGAVSGITLTDTSPESPENTLELPRRERAGPDQ